MRKVTHPQSTTSHSLARYIAINIEISDKESKKLF